MDMSIYFSSVKENLKEFKDLIVKEATEHPIAAIAFTIFPVLAIVAFCVWGARKIYRHYTNETVEKVNTATLPLFQRGLGYLKSKVVDCVSAVKSTPKETWVKAALCASAGLAVYKFFSAGELTPNPVSLIALLSGGTNDLGQTLYYISDGVQCINPPLELIPEGGITALSSLIENAAPIIPSPQKILKVTAASMLSMALAASMLGIVIRGVSALGVGAGLLYNHKTALPRTAPMSSHLSYLFIIGAAGGTAIGTLSSIWVCAYCK